MSDSFQGFSDNVMSPARRVRAVTPNDSTDLPDGITKALAIGTAGNIALIAADDTASVVVAVSPGVLPIRVKRVLATGTTATGITALY